MREKWTILFCTLLLPMGFSAAAQPCGRLQAASSGDLVSYLQQTSARRADAACIALAIQRLGEDKHEPAIPVLTKFLDFRWPPDARQKRRLYAVEYEGRDIHPAANALKQFGSKALPGVLDAIKSPSSSPEAIEEAVSVWMAAYKNQVAGLVLLKQAADRTADPEAKYRLGWAAYKAIGWCNESEKAQCQAAFRSRQK